MPKIIKKLTEKEILNAKPKDKAYKLCDEGGSARARRSGICRAGVRRVIAFRPDRARRKAPFWTITGNGYSPDLNPIEQAFSKLKARLREAAERSVDALWKAIGRIITTFSADECKNYFKNSGYEPD